MLQLLSPLWLFSAVRLLVGANSATITARNSTTAAELLFVWAQVTAWLPLQLRLHCLR